MKATELRIGNYVYRQSDKMIVNRNSIYQIEVVTRQTENKYEPIPLTNEWLINFGFEKSEDVSIFSKDDIYIGFRQNGDFEPLCQGLQYGNSLKYVHQLQNLFFALTEEDLSLS